MILILRTLIADTADSLVQCADFRNCLPNQDAPMSSGPLAVMQGRNFKYDSDNLASLFTVFSCKAHLDVKRVSGACSAGRLASRLSSTPHHLQQSMTLAFLENQLASALTLQSAQEYRYWLLIYARFLVNEGDDPFLLMWALFTRSFQHLTACLTLSRFRVSPQRTL